MTYVEIPETVTKNEYQAFYGCSSLNSVILSNVTKILNCAFQECTCLSNITFSNNLKYITNQVFYKCTNLEQIILPNSLTMLGTAFDSCTRLKEIEIPESVTELVKNTFNGCYLTKITINSNYTVTKYKDMVMGIKQLKHLNISDLVTDLSGDYFSSFTTSLTNLTIGKILKQ